MATGGGYKISQRPLCHTAEIAQEPHELLTPIVGYERMPLVSLEKAVEKLFDFLPDIQDYVSLRLLFNGLFRLPPVSRTVYRGIKLDLSEEYIDGTTIIWWGFSSCTRALNVLQLEQFLGKRGTRTMCVIEYDAGKDISEHSFFPEEKEVLLLPATQFKATTCLDQNDLHIINLEETQPFEPLLRQVFVVPILNDVFNSSKTKTSRTS